MNGHFLKHVREHRHFKVEDVASFTKISLERLKAFEAGTREPSYRQLEMLADVYGLPSYLLASNALPNLPEVLPDFRRPEPKPAHLSPAGMRKIWSAERISSFSYQLAGEIDSFVPKKDLATKSKLLTAEHAAESRSAFDEWLNKNVKKLGILGSAERVFLPALRVYLEARGLIVNINDAPSNDYLGFYITPEAGLPITFVNRKISSRKAQLFTLVHEYCHHLLGTEGVSDPFITVNNTERACNKFAAEFLAPISSFSAHVKAQGRTIREDVSALINKISSLSLLSRQATAIRLREAGFINQTELNSWMRIAKAAQRSEKDEEAEAAGEAHGQPHAKRIGELGYLPTYLAAIAVEKGMIDSFDVQSAMGLSEGLQEKAFALAARRIEVALTQ